ncbi:Uncharacterized conserved protein, cupin superfamily [Cohaesibacter sp. ES.047]|uniref:cupin domain-containing protein n=1 Tax=Cohaesibacter sp. ES.047 TaxID=1798205 RepID=UPI000BB92540|nr:cupin domain-containing protein [Cohaesibacter sp. ES.047]SNY93772.1 Uncharacterized conserved protein, cupin superfamily [Cohaesibacter sp. ES.047]
MANETKNPIANIADLELAEFGNGDQYRCLRARLGSLVGLEKIGCSIVVLEPGKKAVPFHVHSSNEEAFFILEGEGSYRFGDQTHAVKAGDLLAAPVGGAENAHQIINTGSLPMKYLALSTLLQPEVVEYPDSGKFVVIARSEDGSLHKAEFKHIGRLSDAYDYWDGES